MTLAKTLEFKEITGPTTAIPSDVTGVEKILSVGLGFLTAAGGILFVIMFAIGAYAWITAQGQPEKLEKARNQIIQAITGLVILVAAYAIANLIGTLLGLDLFDLEGAIKLITGTTTGPAPHAPGTGPIPD